MNKKLNLIILLKGGCLSTKIPESEKVAQTEFLLQRIKMAVDDPSLCITMSNGYDYIVARQITGFTFRDIVESPSEKHLKNQEKLMDLLEKQVGSGGPGDEWKNE